MIALLAAATLAAATPVPPQKAPPTLFAYAGPSSRLEVLQSNPAVCNKDPRMQQAALDPAILRDSDRRRYAKQRLIDLPRAYMCQAGGGPKKAGK